MQGSVYNAGGLVERRVSPTQARKNFANELVTKAAEHSGMLFVAHGAAGLGKTFLLRELATAATSTGWKTTFVRADEIEQSEPYSFIERLSASGVAPDWYFTPDAHTTPVELARECVTQLTVASDGPGNVIVIDDAQWIDEASQRVLRYVIPRVIRRRTLLAFGVRSPNAPGTFGEFLVTSCEDHSVDTAHELQPLSAREISALVLEQHGALIAADTAQRILDATGGTFLGVASVLAALPEREVSQSHLVWETDIRVKLDDASPLLHSYRHLARSAQLTSELVCLAGHELTPQQLRNAAGLLGEAVELAPAIAADVLTQIGVTGNIHPRHALLADAIADTVSPERSRKVFRALAETTTGHRSLRYRIRGAESWDAELHALVDAYVEDESAHGNLGNASEAIREALRRVEHPEARAKLLADLALVHMEAKTSYLVLDILDELEQLPKNVLHETLCIVLAAHRLGTDFPHERVQRLLMTTPANRDEQVMLAYFAFMVVILSLRSPDSAVLPQVIGVAKAFTAQLPDASETLANPRLQWMLDPVAQLLVLDCYQLVYAQRTADSAAVRQMLPGLAERALGLPDSALKVDALVAIAGAEVSIGQVSVARDHAQRAVDMLDRVGLPWAAGTARVVLVDCMIELGDLQGASDFMDVVEEFAFATMDVEARPAFAALRARIAAVTRADDWEEHAKQARRHREFAWEGYEPGLTLIADCEAARVTGDIAGVLAASEGEWDSKLTSTRHGFLTYRAHALIDAGSLDEAAVLIDLLFEWRGTRWLETWGTLDWLRARLAQAREDSDTALWHYAAAVERGGCPLPLSLTRADYGELLVQIGDAAAGSAQLSIALDELERIGALGYVSRVRDRYAAVASTPATASDQSVLESLTERERQIVSHLARGRSNNQIAESLVVSVATVRTHVSNVLRKLKLSSRGEVAKLLRDYSPDTGRKVEA